MRHAKFLVVTFLVLMAAFVWLMPGLLGGYELTLLGKIVVFGGLGLTFGLAALTLISLLKLPKLTLVPFRYGGWVAACIILLIGVILWTKWSIFIA